MPMTIGQKILTNWMAETGNGMVRHGPKLSEAIDAALDARDKEIECLRAQLNALPVKYDKSACATWDNLCDDLSNLDSTR